MVRLSQKVALILIVKIWFLKKVKSGEVIGYINPIVVNEVYHKLLILEVCKLYDKKPFEAVHFIKNAIHAATCKAFGISDIATNDADFESVSHLRVWRP